MARGQNDQGYVVDLSDEILGDRLLRSRLAMVIRTAQLPRAG
jgi:hypothetical protein